MRPRRQFFGLLIGPLTLLTTLGLLPSRAHAIRLISGFDDVIRQAEVQSLTGSALRLFSTDQGFAAMPELYQAMVDAPAKQVSPPPPPAASSDFLASNGAAAFTIISGITSMYTSSAGKFIEREGYPPARLRFRNWLTDWSVESFKMGEIRKALDESPAESFIFIFDNSDASQLIAQNILKNHRSRSAAVYMRLTVERAIPDGARPFVTAMDIAVAEHKARRLTTAQVNRIGEALMRAKDFERIIPDFAFCPKDFAPCEDADYDVHRKCLAVAAKVANYCQHRVQ